MSFRKRNLGLSGSTRVEVTSHGANKADALLPGVRPSPIDGRPTTSTGTASLDALFAGHSGLALGCSMLIEESGTTDYAGALLRFYAAEGLLQSHHVHVVGLPESWGRELPGVVENTEKKKEKPAEQEKMKIAWRYESLGQFGANTLSRGGHNPRNIAKSISFKALLPPVPIDTDVLPLCHRTISTSVELGSRSFRAGAILCVLPHVRPHEETRPSHVFSNGIYSIGDVSNTIAFRGNS